MDFVPEVQASHSTSNRPFKTHNTHITIPEHTDNHLIGPTLVQISPLPYTQENILLMSEEEYWSKF